MKRLILSLAALLAAGAALAQTVTVPQPVTGFGTLSVTNASALLSTLTAGVNSPAWPAGTAGTMIYVINSPGSAGLLYLCPLGGTCTAAAGIPIAVGAAFGCNRCVPAMTVIAATTATAIAQW